LTAQHVAPNPNSSIEGYQLRLPMYEGPLDVLLRLIERNQLAITDVSLVEVTDQFLGYVAALPETQPSVLAEFTAIASRLLVLKSRSLLPSVQQDEDEPETDDLTNQLIAYKAIRDAAQMLDERQRQGAHAYRRPPTADDWGESADTLRPMPSVSLVQALRRCAERQIPEPSAFRPRAIISLADMARRIIDRLRTHGKTRFSALLSRSADRHEHVAGFVTLLTLWKQRTVEIWQPERFGEIEITPIAIHEQVADD
jgi:segregation and condensation protein A